MIMKKNTKAKKMQTWEMSSLRSMTTVLLHKMYKDMEQGGLQPVLNDYIYV